MMNSLDPRDGRCGIVVDEGLLFRTNEDAFIKTKRKLLDEFDLWCILSLPGGVFTQAGAGVKTNLLFFRSGGPTKRIWYYDLSDLKVSKTRPLTRATFEHRLVPRPDAADADLTADRGADLSADQGQASAHDCGFLALLPSRADSPFSWTLDLAARRAQLALEARPYRDQAQAKRREAAPCAERLQQLKALPRREQDEAAIAALDLEFHALAKEARTLEGKALDLEHQLYDLKAVNPNRPTERDDRTPADLLDFIAQQGREIDAVLAELRGPLP